MQPQSLHHLVWGVVLVFVRSVKEYVDRPEAAQALQLGLHFLEKKAFWVQIFESGPPNTFCV